MTPGFARPRVELPYLYYPRNDRVIINAHNFTPALPTAIVTAVPATMTRNNFTGVVGMRFRATQNLTITSLGRAISTPFAQTHAVSLWSEAGTLLATVDVSSSSTVQDGYARAAITPVNLSSGSSYRIATTELNGGDKWADFLDISTLSDIDSVIAVFSIGAGNIFPASIASLTQGKAYVFPNMYK